MLSHLKATLLALWLPNNERSRTTSRNDGEQTQTGRTDVTSATQKARRGLPPRG
jgi:hypothetical protein